MKTFRAFGPTIGKTKLSKKIITILNNHIDKSQLSKKNDYSSKLASQIKSEIKFSNSFVKLSSKSLTVRSKLFLNKLPASLPPTLPKPIKPTFINISLILMNI